MNDSYKIWLAQTQNSRAASIAGAELAISQAEEARKNSWAYQYGAGFRQLEERVGGLLFDTMRNASIQEETVTAPSGKSGKAYRMPWATGNIEDTMIGERYGLTSNPATRQATTDYSLANITSQLYTMGTAYLNHQLGIETTYVYDQNVASAQQSLNQLLAGYTDKARIPATARGSNAYGDMAKYQQYGFMFAVFAPSADSLALINNMIAAGGHTVNRYQAIVKAHTVFDFIQANAVKIPADPANRPQFVRKMMLGLLQTGVYLWYYNNGDISPFIGSPYGLSNEYIE